MVQRWAITGGRAIYLTGLFIIISAHHSAKGRKGKLHGEDMVGATIKASTLDDGRVFTSFRLIKDSPVILVLFLVRHSHVHRRHPQYLWGPT